jgi:hypothetical protein
MAAAAVAIFSVAFLLLFPLVAQSQQVEFIYTGFNESEGKNITTEGATITKPTGALRLTNSSHNVAGHAFYHEPIQIIDTNSSSHPNAFSFKTSFVFAIVPPSSGKGGYGLAFILSPSTKFPGAQPGHYLGIFNKSNDGNSSNHIFAVEFDTVKGFKEPSDTEGNHVGININGMSSVAYSPAGYFINGSTTKKEEITLESGDQIRAWIEYDGLQKLVNVTIAPAALAKPTKPLISDTIDLTQYLKERMYVGFSAATGDKSSSHCILGWSFSQKGEAPDLNISLLPPPPPREKSPSSFKPFTAVIISLSVFTFILLGLLFSLTLFRKLAHHESLEEWELDCPHRFRYRDLYAATKGFKESEVIGVGGFGVVYKGTVKSPHISKV